MAIRQIRVYDDEILRKQCKEVREIDDKIRQLLEDMVDTMKSRNDAAGLAACQVGVLKRIVVVDSGEEILKLINPKIVSMNGIRECVEGCLSFPGKVGRTVRPQSVTVQALNEKWEEVELTVEGELAKCFCHEIDHLDGKVFLDEVIEFIDF